MQCFCLILRLGVCKVCFTLKIDQILCCLFVWLPVISIFSVLLAVIKFTTETVFPIFHAVCISYSATVGHVYKDSIPPGTSTKRLGCAWAERGHSRQWLWSHQKQLSALQPKEYDRMKQLHILWGADIGTLLKCATALPKGSQSLCRTAAISSCTAETRCRHVPQLCYILHNVKDSYCCQLMSTYTCPILQR